MILIFTGEPDSQDEEDIAMDYGRRRLYCAQVGCNKYYLGLTGIKYHIRKIHPDVYARTLQSETNQNNDTKQKVKELTYHVYSRGRFKCFICNKPFKAIFNLKKHQSVHSEIRPFACTLCDSKFKDETNLKKHLNIHLREFHCPFCEKTYALETELEEHMKYHPNDAKNEEYECNECQAKFPKVKELSLHKSKLHASMYLWKAAF